MAEWEASVSVTAHLLHLVDEGGDERAHRACGGRAVDSEEARGVVEGVGSTLVSSLDLLLLLLLHRVSIGVLVGTSWTSEEGAVGW